MDLSINPKHDLTKKPETLEVIPENIPESLKALTNWVLWRWEKGKNGWTKIPRKVDGHPASSTNPETWTTFKTAHGNYKLQDREWDGIGVVLPHGITGTDLDDCRDIATGELSGQAPFFLRLLDTYTEASPSGTGTKSFSIGHLSDKLRKISHGQGVELYAGDSGRYFTVTGHQIGARTELTDGREPLRLIQSVLTEVEKPQKPSGSDDLATAIECLSFLKEDFFEEYTEWAKVGMAMKSVEDSEASFEAWNEWSSQASNYDGEDGCRSKWDSFERVDGRTVTIASLKFLARERGWNPEKFRTGSISGSELWDKVISREYLIEDILVKGEPCVIGGASKSLKTTIAMDMAVSLATGTPFLGRFEVPRKQPVLFISGESGEGTTQESMIACAMARGLSKADMGLLRIAFRLPKLDDAVQVADLVEEMLSGANHLVIVDPLYRSLRVGDGASNIYSMGERLEQIAEQIHRAKITPLLCHHFKKQGNTWGEPPELEDLSQSGVAEFGRQFLLLKRNEAYKMDGHHSLWFKWGGSAGHQGMGVIEAHTGTRKTGIQWDVILRNVEEWELHKQQAKNESKAAAEAELEDAILGILAEDGDSITREIRERSGRRESDVRTTLQRLEDLEQIQRTKGKGREIVWSLIDQTPDGSNLA